MAVRLDRVQAVFMGLVALTTSAQGLWSRSGYPHRSSDDPIITARIVRGPTLGPLEVFETDEPTELLWSITGAAEGDRVGLAATGARWLVDVPPSPTDGAVRDALLALLDEDVLPQPLPGVTITADGTDAISLVGAVGRMWRAFALGSGTDLMVVSSTPCEVSTGKALCMLELQAYANGEIGAQSVLADLVGGLNSSAAVELRDALGVSLLGTDEPVDLTALAGADWESRASLRMRMVVRSYFARAVDTIDATTLNGTIDDIEVVVNAES